MLSQEEKEYLERVWTDPRYSAAFSGPLKLYQFVKRQGKHKIGLRRIRQFLSNNEACSLQKRVQRKFKRTHVVVQGIDSQWDADLMDVKNILKYNRDIQYILIMQDVFSRYIFTHPLKQKTASIVLSGFKTIFC